MTPLSRLLLALLCGAALLVGAVTLMNLPQTQPVNPARPAIPAAPPAADSDAGDPPLAWVNGEPVRASEVARAQTADRALMALLEITSTEDPSATLQRLVNERLVLQAADRAGFTQTALQTQSTIEEFLSTRSKTPAELHQALASAGLSPDDFYAYYTQLIVVQSFSENQANARGIDPSQYLAQLQQQADLSWAPEAASFSRSPTPAPPIAPSPTVAATAVAEAEPRGIDPGQLAPDFKLQQLDGTELTWGDLVGQPTVLSFWVSWCSHCEAQTPILIEAYQRYAGSGIRFIGINVMEAATTARDYVTAHAIPYPIALDSEGTAAGLYQVSGYPTTYFLDAEGRIAARHVGELTAADIEGYLSPQLAP